MSNDNFNRILVLLSDQLGIPMDSIKESSLIADDLGADSLDTAELAMLIQEKFSFEVKDHEIKQIKTVKDLLDLLDNNVKTGA